MTITLEELSSTRFYYEILCELHNKVTYPRSVDPKTISVTEITQCLRYSYYKRIKPVCVPQVGALAIGTAGHKLITDILAEKGLIVERFVYKERDGVRLIGRIDAYDPNTNTILELKLCQTLPDKPYPDHLLQTLVYKDMINASHALIIYIQYTDISKVRIFRVPEKRSWIDKAFARAKYLSDCLKNKVLPKPEHGRWCRYCPYFMECISRERKNAQ